MLKIGDKVQDFKLFDYSGNIHTLSEYLGKKIVIYFYPKTTLRDAPDKLVILEIIFMKLSG